MARIHMRHPTVEPVSEPAEGRGVACCRPEPWEILLVTDDLDAVTCARCPRAYARIMTAPTGAEEEVAEAPFVVSAPAPMLDVRGSTELDDEAMAAIERSLRGHVERPYAWRSVEEALRTLAVFRADGQGVTSTSNPARFERLPQGQGDPTRKVAGEVERVHGVDAARARAFTEPRTFTWTRCSCGAERGCDQGVVGHTLRVESIELSVAQQLQILDWSLEMRIERGSTPLSASSAAPLSASSVALRAEKAWGIEISERQVALVTKAGLASVRAHLRAIGELAPPEREAGKGEEDMGALGYDLSGWDAIEEYTGLSSRTLRRLSEREDDPLPVYEIPGVRGYHAKKAELDAWFEKNAQLRGSAA